MKNIDNKLIKSAMLASFTMIEKQRFIERMKRGKELKRQQRLIKEGSE